jgi:hypothetical protein
MTDDMLARLEALATLRELFRAAYPDPDPSATLEAYRRDGHADVETLSLEELDRERIMARIRWALEGHGASEWLCVRLQRLDDAARWRHRANGSRRP